MSRIEFPNEPIRVHGDPFKNGAYFPIHDPIEENYEVGDDDEDRCDRCGGDQFIFCADDDQGCPEADDLGCPYTPQSGHMYACPECAETKPKKASKDKQEEMK